MKGGKDRGTGEKTNRYEKVSAKREKRCTIKDDVKEHKHRKKEREKDGREERSKML